MSKRLQHDNKLGRGKIVLGLMVASLSLLIGTAGVAGATNGNMGFGYGGDVHIDIGHIIGDNNVIVIIINYIVGG
jgi:hypothetical protein